MNNSTKPLANLSPDEKRTLLAQLLQKKVEDEQLKSGSSILKLPTIVPNPEQKYLPFPLTEIQQAYWLGRMEAFAGGNIAIHLYMELESNHLDVERLNLALQRLIDRHDMLRAIVLLDGQQQILEQVPAYKIEVTDLQGQDSEAVAAHLLDIRQRLSHQVLLADQWPLFEIRASRLNKQYTRLHISLDALNLDIGSFMILFCEWVQLYQNLEAPLTPLELSYRDYVLGLNALQDSELYQKSLSYWRQRLDNLPSAPDLPLNRHSRPLTQPKFQRYASKLDAKDWQQLKAKAGREGLTPSCVLLAAYAEVLAIWSKSAAFTINVTLFNRLPLHPQVNNIMGDFTSIILLEVNNSEPDSFINRAKRIQKQLWNDLEYRYVSGVQVLRELAQHHGRVGEVIMPIVFTSTLDSVGSTEGLTALSQLGEIIYSISQTPQVWLDHQVFEEAGVLSFNWDVLEDIFPNNLIQDIFTAYCHLLQQLAHGEELWHIDSHQKIFSDIFEGLSALRGDEAIIPQELLQTLFTKQVVRQPNQVAIVAADKTLTYAELDCRSNQVGHKLRQLGTHPNKLVAVIMHKGWEQIVAVLGILKSGSAYLPIDPDIPQERLFYLLENGEVEIVLTQSSLNESLDWPRNIQRLCLDGKEFEAVDNQALEAVQKPEDLAYVLYTSGSTGSPKGVMIEHRSVVNRIIDINQRFAIGPQDRVLALTALHHDLSVYDIFGVLAAGGTIVVPNASLVRDPAHWVGLINQEKVTIWNSVPAFMQMLVEHLEANVHVNEDLPHSVRLVLLAGDWIPVTLPDRLRALIKDVQVIGLGGPTETTIWDICYPIEEVDPTWKSIPYGKPMVNTSYHVLNEKLVPCPTWVSGRLYISGAGLARGYWRNEEKTKEKFVQHPQTGERLYHSGDLGRLLPDGNIEFVGREDFQVKIRGYRIELGEIEAALRQHPKVQATVVTAVESQGNKHLVAYVVPKKNQEHTASKSQSSLESKLSGDFTQNQLEGVLLNPIERLEFKLKQTGLRQEPERTCIQLKKPECDETLLASYLERHSYRDFLQQPIPLEQFDQFLSCLCQIQLDTLPKYRYPSAGSLYPVQTYLYIRPNCIKEIPGGTYYYNPKEHCLLLLSEYTAIESDIHAQANRSIFDQSAFSIFLVGQLNAMTPMYGELSKEFCLLEAGYMGQLMMENASAGEIGLCPIGGLKFDKIRHLFVLEESHILLHSFIGGRIASAHSEKQLLEHSPSVMLSLQEGSQTSSNHQFIQDTLTTEDLENFLIEKLPEHTIPSSFIFLDALPLTSNGKVDRKSLPNPEDFLSNQKVAYVLPRNNFELTLIEILKEVLHIEVVGVYDNFFDLGATSIHIVQVYNKLQKLLNADLSIIDMFKHPTIDSLSQYLEQKENKVSLEESSERAKSRREAVKRRQISQKRD